MHYDRKQNIFIYKIYVRGGVFITSRGPHRPAGYLYYAIDVSQAGHEYMGCSSMLL